MAIPDNRTEAFALVQRALRIQLGHEEGDLAEAEVCLLKALDLDPDGIEALQEAAHFFDAVTPDPARANDCALRCRAQAIKLTAEMDEILLDEDSN